MSELCQLGIGPGARGGGAAGLLPPPPNFGTGGGRHPLNFCEALLEEMPIPNIPNKIASIYKSLQISEVKQQYLSWYKYSILSHVRNRNILVNVNMVSFVAGPF